MCSATDRMEKNCLVFRLGSFSSGKASREEKCTISISLYVLLLVLKGSCNAYLNGLANALLK